MEIRNDRVNNPFFSICIPQYNRTSFLIEACKVLAQQTFKDFEVCISDDISTDGREQDLIDYLQQSGLSFVYKKQEKNQRYDGNIRASIALAKGKYCFLHGNDDCLSSPTILADLHREIQQHPSVGAVITNYEDWATGEPTRRIKKSSLVGSGAEIAATHFRNLAFVTGIIVDRLEAQKHTTDKWDGSEMYQMYIISRTLASGTNLLELEMSAVKKDIRIPGETVDNYTNRPKVKSQSITPRQLPMGQIGALVADAIAPYLNDSNRGRIIEQIFLQLYLFTYPFWMIEYRRVQSWQYALEVFLGLKPNNVFWSLNFSIFRKCRLFLIYIVACVTGLIIPIGLFDNLRPQLFHLSKSIFTKKNQISTSVVPQS